MSTTTQQHSGLNLRYLADTYEQSQRVRIEAGERIRAVLQGRDETWQTEGWQTDQEPDKVLAKIKTGKSDGPVALLGRTYRRHWEEEREMYREMMRVLVSHPAWPWLDRVRGIGPTLACKLLARLDIEKADTPSAFWAYCGLATVPAAEYRCEACGLRKSFPPSYKVKGPHLKLGSERKCKGQLTLLRGPDDGVRCAQPKPARGEKAAYDMYAKKVCYLVGASFRKCGGPYEEYYREQCARLDRERPGWPDGRKRLTALRKTEKLFLSHLYQVWREAVGLPLVQPYIHAQEDGHQRLDPWAMVEEAD